MNIQQNQDSDSFYKLTPLVNALDKYLTDLEKLSNTKPDTFVKANNLQLTKLDLSVIDCLNQPFNNLTILQNEEPEALAKAVVSFLLNEKKVNIALFTLGQKPETWIGEMLAYHCEYDLSEAIRTGNISIKKWQKLQTVVTQFEHYSLFINEFTFIPQEIKQSILFQNQKTDIDSINYIVIDFNYLKSSEEDLSQNDTVNRAEYINSLKTFGKEFNIPIVLI